MGTKFKQPGLPTNEERAEVGRKAVMDAYGETIKSGGIDLATGIIDLVADLLHLAHQENEDPEQIIDMARTHFEAEIKGEP